jgi:beta-lactamase superfamily II metal-dependent hydrolase
VSAGQKNAYGHPHPAVLDRYAAARTELATTCSHCTVEFVTDGAQLWIRNDSPA